MAYDAAFLRAMASAPDHSAIAMAYADWFEERGDPRCELLRLWSELLVIPYSEETFESILTLAARYRQQVSQADPKWLAQVGRARVWIDQELARKLVQVYLRVRHGRKENRQRIGFESWPWNDEWHVYYWRQPPSHKQTSWRGKSWLWVNKLSGEIRGDHHW